MFRDGADVLVILAEHVRQLLSFVLDRVMKNKLVLTLFCGVAVYCWIDHSRQARDLVGSESVYAANAASSKMQAVGHPTFASPHASPIRVLDRFVFVVNTPSDTVDVINADTREITKRINVGIDPVSLATKQVLVELDQLEEGSGSCVVVTSHL